jgi:anti-sigma factor RsiW
VIVEPNAFSPEPDPALGAALRRALDRPNEAEFVAAVLEGASRAGVGSSRAVLGRWIWRLAATAALAALLGGVLAGTASDGEPSTSVEASWVAGVTDSPAAAALLTAQEAPDPGILFATLASN